LESAKYLDLFLKEKEEVRAALDNASTTVEVVEEVAIVKSSLRAATAIGYSVAPIVIALNERFPFQETTVRKFTVCQYSDQYLDMSRIKSVLNDMEPGWGGSNTIIGSPQGESSNLTVEQVMTIVQAAKR
jgi:hypothetical protein